MSVTGCKKLTLNIKKINFLNPTIHLLYGLSGWGQTSKSNPAKIWNLQKRVICLIYFHNKRDHALPLFLCSNILLVKMLYLKSIFLVMHDIQRKGAPPNLLDLFSQVDSVHSYYTFCCSFTQNIQSFTSTVETITQIYIH